ncbi:hypothetical protein RB614_18775 [Phytohabitans sp. ZYX-F-186]|uniref:Uncharacterized protein n=1 Tax=Phytohabitans maris TaxID=3071409 RepID=A0ABU0ZHV7_9ACTN|nr:hypothetical protein [Phytohabitans sp. ZYX-F-186]MDQ7906563.1 hypothetical protein [Phytohabitans sp. ZYX-F-186]
MTDPRSHEDERQQQPAVPQQPAAGQGSVGRAAVGPPPAVARPAVPAQYGAAYAQQAAPPPPPRTAPPPPQAPQVPVANPPTGGMVIGRDPTLSAPVVQVPPPSTAGPQSSTVARQAAAAATAAQAAAATAAQAGARAIADTGQEGPPGTVYDSRRPPNGGGRQPLLGKLARLRIGSHTVSRPALAKLRLSAPGTGLILGADRQQRPVSVRFFRPEPTRIALVGGAWAGMLVAFRALALGARVAVITADPRTWHGFGERATGRGDRVAVFPTEQPLALAASAQQPVLLLYDLGLVGPNAPQQLGPWQTQMTVLRQLDQSGVPSVQDCDLVMLQRLGSAEAALIGGALRLPASSTQFLQVMADDMIALVGDGSDRYIWFSQTDVERQYAGAPRR